MNCASLSLPPAPDAQVQARVDALANVMVSRWNIGEDDVGRCSLLNETEGFSHSEILLLGSCNVQPEPRRLCYHDLGCSQGWGDHFVRAFDHASTCIGFLTSRSPANPSFSVDELVYQLDTTKASLIFVHSSVFGVALEAAKVSGIPSENIVLIDTAQPNGVTGKPLPTVEQLVFEGTKLPPRFTEKKLKSGEGKTKVAVSGQCSLSCFLSWLISCLVPDLLFGYYRSAKGKYHETCETRFR